MTTDLTKETFKEKIFDYETESDWNFTGDKPALIDLWAPWCGPCKMTSPVLEQISEERDDIDIYKINVDEEEELAIAFGVQSIPTFILIPTSGKPKSFVGALPKETFNEIIDKEAFSSDE